MPSYALPVGPVPELTGDSMYPTILYPDLYGPKRDC